MNYLLDTDFTSQSSKAAPEERAQRWIAAIDRTHAFLSVVSLFEIQAGLESMPNGQRRRRFEAWFAEDILVGYVDRILPITGEIAILAGTLSAATKRKGHNPGLADVLIAATALHHGMTLATLNRKHFRLLGVPMVDLDL